VFETEMRTILLASVLAVAACSQKKAGDTAPPPSGAPSPSAAASASAPASPVTSGKNGDVCGELACELFDSPEAAFARVLEDKPAVLAVGETHAPAGAPSVPSTTKRFTEIFLPKLEGTASDLVLELWVANSKCNTAQQKQQIKQVASQQKEVTQNQAQSNQTEFLALYTTARAKKMRAHLLVPDCDEYAKILDAGVGDVDAMLSMIARLTGKKIEELLAGQHGLVVAYGGAMHNDLSPRKGREAWSFGPRVSDATKGQYVELDLIVPEFVGDTDAWKSQAWYPHWKRGAQGAKTLLYTVRPGSYTMVFPETKR
jgi:hypothetical protein